MGLAATIERSCSVEDCDSPVLARSLCQRHYRKERKQEAVVRHADYKRNNGGKPSSYRPEYCDMVVEICSEGYTLTAFAGKIGVSRETVNKWQELHPEFADAVTRAKAGIAAWWQDRGRKVAEDGGPGGQAQMVIFGLKNVAPEDFSDRQHVELTGAGGKDLIPEASEDRLSALLERVVGKVIDHEPAPRLLDAPDEE
jgi:hypothetical protein